MMLVRKGKLSQDEITTWLLSLRNHPYVPESGFGVTAVFRARLKEQDDYYFAGVNVENIDHRVGTHGEEACLAAMVTGLGPTAEVVEGWVMGAPKGVKPADDKPSVDTIITCCGKCRQQIAGFADEAVKINSVTLRGKIVSTTVGAFLPGLYTYRHMRADSGGIHKMETAAPAPSCEVVENKLMRPGPVSEKEIFRWLHEIESVDYTSKISQSMILKLDNGMYVSGATIEEVASVSMNAAQTAVSIAVTAFGECRIEKVWIYTQGRDGKELPAEGYGVPTLAALQTLLQLAERNVPVCLFAGNGSTQHLTLLEVVHYPSKSGKSFYMKRDFVKV